MKRLIIYIATAVLCLSFFLWWYYQPELVLTRKLNGLIEALCFAPDSTRSARLMKNSSVTSYFADPTEITSPYDEATGSFTRTDLGSGYAYLAESAREISIVPVGEFAITLEGEHATIVFEAEVNVAINRFMKAVNGKHRVTTHWVKSDQGWLIHSSDWQEIP